MHRQYVVEANAHLLNAARVVDDQFVAGDAVDSEDL